MIVKEDPVQVGIAVLADGVLCKKGVKLLPLLA